ncbi:MAG: SPOR domain-containing protein [Magnetococcales bacterium]|nr:SPOR domain-containing protein [Magnetococcales bacterium]
MIRDAEAAIDPSVDPYSPVHVTLPTGKMAEEEPAERSNPLDTWSPNAAMLEATRHALPPEKPADPPSPAAVSQEESPPTGQTEVTDLHKETELALKEAELARKEAELARKEAEMARKEVEPEPLTPSPRVPEPVEQPGRLLRTPAPVASLHTTTRLFSAHVMAPPIKESPSPVPSAPLRTTSAPPPQEGDGNREYWVKLATFSNEANAQSLFQSLSALALDGGTLPISQSEASSDGKTYFRIRMGPFADRSHAERAAQVVQQQANISGTVFFLKK